MPDPPDNAERPERPDSVVLIANPVSGRGRGADALREAESELRRRGLHASILPTRGPGHATELAATAAAAGAALVLALGGDGTVRDVAQGLLGTSAALGILPGGTGNDLARTLGLPRSLPAALDIALGAGARELDCWRWNQTIFVNVAGIGLDAAVADTVNRRFRRLHGTLAYLVGFTATFPRYRPFPLVLVWPDGEWRGEAWLAAFANANCYGGGMRIAPDAMPDDGLLDVIVIEALPRLALLRAFPGIFTGAHVRHPRVRSFRVPEVRVEAPPQQASLDGELLAGVPASITHAGRLRVRVAYGVPAAAPRGGAHREKGGE